MIDKLHRINFSLLKKNYTIDYYNENAFYIVLSFHHLNSVYNGLCYISKEKNKVIIDFQYHTHNKAIEKQLNALASVIYKLYKLNQFELVKTIISNYRTLAIKKYNEKYSLLEV